MNASDRKLKDNIEDIPEDECINLLRTVNAKTYIRNDMTDNKRRAGFIAQDCENVSMCEN